MFSFEHTGWKIGRTLSRHVRSLGKVSRVNRVFRGLGLHEEMASLDWIGGTVLGIRAENTSEWYRPWQEPYGTESSDFSAGAKALNM